MDTVRESALIGKAARKTMLEHHMWDKIADNVEECYEDMLHEHMHIE